MTEVKPGRLEEYIKRHDKIYPEVTQGLRKAGVIDLHIFRVPSTAKLVMTIRTKPGLDLAKATGPGSKVIMKV